MEIEAVKLIYFSPTRTTKKILEAIASGLSTRQPDHMDLTPPGALAGKYDEITDGIAIIGSPVYGGRIPLPTADRLRRFRGKNVPAIVAVVYGNRAYEDALIELRNLAVEIGFIPIAGGAFIAEHSYATESLPIANGRPDLTDLEKASEFGKRIRKKIESAPGNRIEPVWVPGNFPYRQRSKSSYLPPITDLSLCKLCNTCSAVCPTGAITVEDNVKTDPALCIHCCACIKNCPQGARGLQDPAIIERARKLSETCRDRKEPETYL